MRIRMNVCCPKCEHEWEEEQDVEPPNPADCMRGY